MSVYDSATKLASDIKSSKEYRSFKKHMKEVKEDKESEKLLAEYKMMQLELQGYAINNKKIEKVKVKQMEDVQKKVANNKVLTSYLASENRFTQMMDNINRILSDAVEKDYK